MYEPLISAPWWSPRLSETTRTFDEVLNGFGGTDRLQLEKAYEFATEKHKGQKRRGSEEPYVVHPLRVVISLVRSFGIENPDLLAAALLHDVMEDTECTVKELERAFSGRVAQLVSSVTRKPDEKRPPGGDSALSPYLLRVRKVGEEAVILKLADKIDNLRDARAHPSPEKRHTFAAETLTAYVPFLEIVSGASLRLKLSQRLLAATFDLLPPGGSIPATPAPVLRHALDCYLLFNPLLHHWISCDGVEATVSQPGPRDLLRNAACLLLQRIEAGEVGPLSVASVTPQPWPGAEPRAWERVSRQLETLCFLLSSPSPPDWLSPISSARGLFCGLLLLQSAFFRPVSWSSNHWEPDGGAALARNSEIFRAVHDCPTDWHHMIAFALEKRGALWRFWTGRGTRAPVNEIEASGGAIEEGRLRWALRLASEYLGQASDREEISGVPIREPEGLQNEFNELWSKLSKVKWSLAELRPPLVNSEFECKGVNGIRERCKAANLSGQWEALEEHLHKRARASACREKWIVFDRDEWAKRWPDNTKDLSALRRDTAWGDLESCGVRIDVDEKSQGVIVLFVRPSRRSALRNRLPEILEADLDAIAAEDYSAVSIFDRLIGDKLSGTTAASPLWMPRLFRVIDSMEALDPKHVQQLTLHFSSPEPIAPFKAFLPLPRHSGKQGQNQNQNQKQKQKQKLRKRVIACYLAVHAYNSGVIRRLFRAYSSCENVPGDQAFTQEELHTTILTEAAAIRLDDLARYIGNFNYETFGIGRDDPRRGQFAFTSDAMRGGGLFLGIDIGGTNVKVVLFRSGKIVALKHSEPRLLNFPTREEGVGPGFHEGKVNANLFCQRIIDTIKPRLPPGVTWGSLAGIGLSWPGAVRDQHIVCSSGVLGSLSWNGLNDVFRKSSQAPAKVEVKPGFFQEETHPWDIARFDLVAIFRAELQRSLGRPLPDDFIITLENDGNAEALGGYALKLMADDSAGSRVPRTGAIIIKFGTSTAGGRITALGAIAGDVAEYSRATLDFGSTFRGKTGAASLRQFLSGAAVRDLTRSFEFNGRTLFRGPAKWNDEGAATRVGSHEIGRLLYLWDFADPDKLLSAELIRTDGVKSGPDGARLCAHLAKKLAAAGRTAVRSALIKYVLVGKWPVAVARLYLLATGEERDFTNLRRGTFPKQFPWDAVAHLVAGSVALFSRLGLQTAHAIALLYNIYRRDAFRSIILAGGVMNGRTGPLVVAQTNAFLLKYYDKIVASNSRQDSHRSLPVTPVTQAIIAPAEERPSRRAPCLEAIGPFGAALVAIRERALRNL